MKFWIPYLMMVIYTFGYVWHHDCDLRWSDNTHDRAGSIGCSIVISVFNPIFWPLKMSVILLDPKISLPIPKIEWK